MFVFCLGVLCACVYMCTCVHCMCMRVRAYVFVHMCACVCVYVCVIVLMHVIYIVFSNHSTRHISFGESSVPCRPSLFAAPLPSSYSLSWPPCLFPPLPLMEETASSSLPDFYSLPSWFCLFVLCLFAWLMGFVFSVCFWKDNHG